MLLTHLPLDLIHNLFLMSDDRRTLAALFSTNRHLYRVFKTHPNSILSQVVCNEIGMDIRVLPYARANTKSEFRHMVTPEKLMETVEIVSTDASILSLTSKIFKLLKVSHGIVRRFSKHYSIRYKEGRILRDTLTAEESRRFQIAAYLFLHYQTVWGNFQKYASEYSDDGEVFTGIAREDPIQDAKTTDACRTFLSRLPTEELFWIQEFRDFLLQDMENTLDLKNNPTYFTQLFHARNNVHSIDTWRHFLLSVPILSLGDWNYLFINSGHILTRLHREELWLTDALSRVLHYRGARTQADDEKILRKKGILIAACQKCGKFRGRRKLFFNKTSEILIVKQAPTPPASSYLLADLDDFSLYWNYFTFPGQLSRNPVETGRAFKRVHPSGSRFHVFCQSESLVVIRETMEHAEKQAASSLGNGGKSRDDGLVVSDDDNESDQAKDKTPQVIGNYKWSPDDVLCLPCFAGIFSDLYYAWWLEERQTDRVEAHTFADGPCLLGKDCCDQVEEDHATRRDHCCPRTTDVVL